MNKFKKYCPNVWVAECDEEYEKGEVIQLETKYGKEVDCEVYNLIANSNGKYFYSIVRVEEKTFAERKAEKYKNAVISNTLKSNERMEAAQEGREFLSLAEPIKVGHHSENRHRALIDRNNRRMDKSMEYYRKAENQKLKAEYWEDKSTEITLAMPSSIDYFEDKLLAATNYQKGLKDGTIPREHSYSLQYASKNVRDLKNKVRIAKILWE